MNRIMLQNVILSTFILSILLVGVLMGQVNMGLAILVHEGTEVIIAANATKLFLQSPRIN